MIELGEIRPQNLWEQLRESRLAKIVAVAGIAIVASGAVSGCGEHPRKFHCPPQDVNRNSVNGGCQVLISVEAP